jgi:hypothetical protein
MKQTLLSLLALILFLTPKPATAQQPGDFVCTTNGNAITITEYNGPGGSVTIPSTLYGMQVTSIDVYAFSSLAPTIITIPNSVTNIAGNAFSGCSSLTAINVDPTSTYFSTLDGVLFDKNQSSLIGYPEGKQGTYTIPNSVTNVASYAFGSCYGLTNVIIPNSVTSIGDSAFAWCSGLTNILIPSSVTSIGYGVFSGCSSITAINVDPTSGYFSTLDGVLFDKSQSSLIQYPGGKKGSYTIPNSVTNIAGYAFEFCGGLTNVLIPNSVTSIGDSAFSFCFGLSNIILPNGLASIGQYMFYNCYSLTNITIPNSVTTIGDGAFQQCGLAYATIGDSVTSIGNYAFSYCWKLISISIPNSVTTIGDSAFDQCYGLAYATIGSSVTRIGNFAFRSCQGLISVSIPNSVTNIGDQAFDNCSGLISIFIPNSVTSIGEGAFGGCQSLTSIVIPSSVNNIPSRAFESCSQMTIIIIPNSVTNIGDNAFYGCGSLTSITIPSSVTSIGDFAFESCGSLTSITIPNSVTSIGDGAFAYCWYLISINVDPTSAYFSSSGGVLFNKNLTKLVQCPQHMTGNYSIPSSVTSIGNYAFAGCGWLSIVIPNSVISIGDHAFAGYGKTSIIIPNSVRSIGSSAFSYSELTSIVISSSVTNIGYGPFASCSSLEAISVDPLNPSYSAVDGVLFDKNQTTLIQYPGTEVMRYTIPSSVMSIGGYAFSGCAGLTNVTIPNAVTNIGDYAFSYCSGLISTFFMGNAPTLGEWAFDRGNLYYLPGTTGWGSINAYPAAPLLWNPAPRGVGITHNQFGFDITGTTNIPIVVEARTNQSSGAWVTLQSSTLTNGLMHFADPDWTNHPTRFYRIRSP